MIYLRARYYSPNLGRFVTKDTWKGIPSSPISFNPWIYANNNPVNLVDPTGKYPIHCQGLPTKALYEGCVLSHYNLDPIDPLQMGVTVEGSTGCYRGPTSYRAPGYVEGIGGYTQAMLTAGMEVVYDFATMERAKFIYAGEGMTDTWLGGSVFAYVGYVTGFKYSRFDPTLNLVNDYSGNSTVSSFGLSVGVPLGYEIGLGLGAGATSSQSIQDPLVQGVTFNVGGAFSFDPAPILDISGMNVRYSPTIVEDYKDANGMVNSTKLIADLSSGNWSPLYLPGLIPGPVDLARRITISNVWKYISAYTELRFQEHLDW